jgi:hypothetical protein
MAPTVATHIDELKTLMTTQQASFDAKLQDLQILQATFLTKQTEVQEAMEKT